MSSKSVFIDCPIFLEQLFTQDLRRLVPHLEINVGDPTNVADLLAGTRGVINDHTIMDSKLLKACPDLEVIVFMGTGASSYIDLDIANELDIKVKTIQNYGNRSIAEHAIALMFSAGRQITRMDRNIRSGIWETLDGIEFEHKTLGVVGTGGIGCEMVRLGSALGMKVLAWNRSGTPTDIPCKECSLDDLISKSDVISLHLALNNDTKEIIDSRRINLMQPHALLINTSRGAIVDEKALILALKNKSLAYAGLDVFTEEPLPEHNELLQLENVTLTSHAGFMTREASQRLLASAIEILRTELDW